MRVRVSGSTITAHGDALGTPYVEFPGNEPPGFPTDWTVAGSSPNRVLTDPHGQSFAVELPTTTAPAVSGSGLPSQWTDGGNGDVTATTDNSTVPLTVVGQVTIEPGAADLYGLFIQALAGNENFYNAFVRVIDEHGNLIFTIDQGGFDNYALPAGHTHVSLRESDTGNISELGSDDLIGLNLYSGALGTFAQISVNTGVEIGGFAPAASPLPGHLQLYYDKTIGAAAFKFVGRNANNDPVTLDLPLFVNGHVGTRSHSAPADADLVAGDMALWFDQTNGASAPQWKGKSANGTVVNGGRAAHVDPTTGTLAQVINALIAAGLMAPS